MDVSLEYSEGDPQVQQEEGFVVGETQGMGGSPVEELAEQHELTTLPEKRTSQSRSRRKDRDSDSEDDEITVS